MNLEVQNVTISPEELRSVIASLDEAIERNSRLKELCEEILRVQSGQGGRSALKGAARRRRRGKTLRQTILEILGTTKKPLGAGALRDKVLEAGYQTSATPHSFYTAVYNTANQHPDVERTDGGFRLSKSESGSASKGSAKAGRKRAKKKAGRKRK